jgi:HK97 family phage portal protein
MSWLNKLLNINKKDFGSTVVSGGMEVLAKLTGSSLSMGKMLETYGKSLYVFACISKIAQKVASIDYKLYRIINSAGDTKEIFSHPALDLLYKPNPFQTKTEFDEIRVINLKCTGDAFIFKVRNAGGKVVELWNLRPDFVTIITDPVDFIKGYEFAKSDGSRQRLAANDVIHIKYPNPLNQYLGMSPLHAAQKRVQTEEFATEWQRDFFLNNARPDALIKNPQTTLTPDQKEDIREGWNKLYKGPGNSSKVAILEGGLDYQLISLNQKEMDFIESMKFTRDDILVAFAVPKPIVAITDDVNRANAETAMYIFLSETIKPEVHRIVENLNEQLIYDEYGEEFYLDFDDPTPANRDMQLREYSQGIASNYLLINEVRSSEGLAPIKGGWSFYMPIMNQAMGGLSSEDQKSLVKKVLISDNEKEIKEFNDKKIKRYDFRGRFYLKQKFIIYETMKQATIDTVKSLKKGKKKGEQSWVSLIKGDELRDSYAKMINKKIDSQTTKLKDEATAFFMVQKQRVLGKLAEKRPKAAKTKLKVSSIFNMDKEVGLSVDFIIPYIEQYLKESGMEALNMIAPQEDFKTTAKIQAMIKKRAEEFATTVNSTTLDKLDGTLAEGIAAGEGISDLSNRVEAVYQDFPAYRSEAIARTEATAANGQGALEGYRQSDVATGKEWIAASDDRECEVCAALNGEIVSLDKMFSDGASYPPDHVNCRCVLGPAFLE